MKKTLLIVALIATQLTLIAQVRPFNYTELELENLTILSWNVENFVDEYDSPYIDAQSEVNYQKNTPVKVELLVDAIKKVKADVVVLQEFESAVFLKQIATTHFPEMGYHFFTDAGNMAWYQNVVVMSRVPLGIQYNYNNIFTPFVGESLIKGREVDKNYVNNRMFLVKVEPTPTYSFWLAAVHLKAGRKLEDAAERRGQIQFLKSEFEKLCKENPSVDIVAVGDFNAAPDSDEIALMTQGKKCTQFLSDMPETSTNKHIKRQIDYIFVNQNMLSKVVKKSTKVIEPFSKQEFAIFSDHFPVITTILIKESKK